MIAEKGVSRFYKIDSERYHKDVEEYIPSFIKDVSLTYDEILLPKRATKSSAGYDFYAPFDFTLKKGQSLKVPTGIRCKMNDDVVLFIVPRSSLGFKYRLQLDNTIGVIDSDYYYSDNQGHIFVKITNDSKEDKVLTVKKGEAFCQGIFVRYLLTEDDDTTAIRNGGLGSTNAT
ncbi:MAG: deoxyuridine 5'-triphosphate nucleotidohydrolase [Lachnospiraceae bacterium]|nr:deoxyuridine 5'-triphosphate nucleotidohydrolase [Lachnospiraceae bacterium]